jgi:hypothetical protein
MHGNETTRLMETMPPVAVDLTPHISQMLVHEQDFRVTAVKGKTKAAEIMTEARRIAQQMIDNATTEAKAEEAKADRSDAVADWWHETAVRAATEAKVPLPVLPQQASGHTDPGLGIPAVGAMPELNGGPSS